MLSGTASTNMSMISATARFHHWEAICPNTVMGGMASLGGMAVAVGEPPYPGGGAP